MSDDVEWTRYRFRANEGDPRPVRFPPPGPWWCTGSGDGYATVVAYLPHGEPLTDWWPEADEIASEPRREITFTDRFPAPDWWLVSAIPVTGVTDHA